jgi:uncharacterized protein YjbJ (UPF0337 family)
LVTLLNEGMPARIHDALVQLPLRGGCNSTEEANMTINKDQVKGAAKDIGGKIQEEVGKLIGSKEQEAKGLKHQVEGKLQRKVGEVKEAVGDLKEAVKKA